MLIYKEDVLKIIDEVVEYKDLIYMGDGEYDGVYTCDLDELLERIDELSGKSEEPGKWIAEYYIDYNGDQQLDYYRCSKCGEHPLKNGSEEPELSSYCPHCGKYMRGEE